MERSYEVGERSKEVGDTSIRSGEPYIGSARALLMRSDETHDWEYSVRRNVAESFSCFAIPVKNCCLYENTMKLL